MDTVEVRLPGGYFDHQGRRHRDVEIAMLSGREEELVADRAGSPAILVSELLTETVTRVGTEPMTIDVARALTVGDRLFLLLRLRELSIGPEVRTVVSCPWFGCGSKIDLDFQLSDIPIREEDEGPEFDVELTEEAGAVDRNVRFRLPNGADQELLAPLVGTNPAASLSALLARCIVAIDGNPPTGERIEALSSRARAEIETAMAAHAPGPLLRLEADCPECSRSFSLPFDIQDLFFGELHTTSDLLFREVHYLAYHYHWSESDILDMSRERRRRYIDVLSEEIERLNDAMV